MSDTTHWVGTWTATPAPGEGAAFANHTLRMMPRVSLGGSVLRVRISNAYGTRPLAIGAARVGVRRDGPAVVAGSNRRITFGGEPSATIAAGALIVSDPVRLEIAPLSDLAVSVHLPGDLPASFGITGRYARQTNYISPPGDFAAEDVMPVGRLTDDWYFVCGVDVVAPADGANGRPADGGHEPGAGRQSDPARYPGRQRSSAVRSRRAGAARCHARRHHARHERSPESPGQARGRGHRAADDRGAQAVRGARPGPRDQGGRR